MRWRSILATSSCSRVTIASTRSPAHLHIQWRSSRASAAGRTTALAEARSRALWLRGDQSSGPRASGAAGSCCPIGTVSWRVIVEDGVTASGRRRGMPAPATAHSVPCRPATCRVLQGRSGREFRPESQPWAIDEDRIVCEQRNAPADRCRRDPQISVVGRLMQRVTDLPALVAQQRDPLDRVHVHRKHPHRLHEAGDLSQPARAPSGLQRAVAHLRDGLRRDGQPLPEQILAVGRRLPAASALATVR
jgi:hypothetical protein